MGNELVRIFAREGCRIVVFRLVRQELEATGQLATDVAQ